MSGHTNQHLPQHMKVTSGPLGGPPVHSRPDRSFQYHNKINLQASPGPSGHQEAPCITMVYHQSHGLHRTQAFDPPGAGRKAYRGIRLRPATPRAGAWARPEGRRSPADMLRRCACPMPHIALRASPCLSAGQHRADHDLGENCGPGSASEVSARSGRSAALSPPTPIVMPGLVPGIHFFGRVDQSVCEPADGRNECGHDVKGNFGKPCELRKRGIGSGVSKGRSLWPASPVAISG